MFAPFPQDRVGIDAFPTGRPMLLLRFPGARKRNWLRWKCFVCGVENPSSAPTTP